MNIFKRKLNNPLGENKTIIHLRFTFSYVFQILLFLFLLILLVQQFYPTWVNSRVNVNWLMISVIIFGVLSVLFPPHQDHLYAPKKNQPRWINFSLIIGLGLLGIILMYLKLKSLGGIGITIAILGGIVISLLSYMILNEEEN